MKNCFITLIKTRSIRHDTKEKKNDWEVQQAQAWVHAQLNYTFFGVVLPDVLYYFFNFV